jgi:enoyl-[acyl-carrier protein] reductase II
VKPAPIKNRDTEMTGVDYPILQAPMGWIAPAQLTPSVSNAGAMGVIETSLGDFDAIRGEVAKMHQITDKPFGIDVALAFVKGANVIDFRTSNL